ncbi:MAG: 4'-phosphopantetheinyl transferase family protein [Ginsengibacter sp.]
MPLFYQHNINGTSKLAVWHITEPENFFLQKVHLQKGIGHPHKRLQHLAGRYLLQLLHPEFPLHLIEIAQSNKPLLPDESFHFSISHCGDFAASIISKDQSAGIDVELITPKVELIQHKFLSNDELKLLPELNTRFLTLSWSCKEAVYKWYGKGGVDFKNHIHLNEFLTKDKIINCDFLKDEKVSMQIHYKFFKEMCLTWIEQ